MRVGVLAVANYLRAHGHTCKAFIAQAHPDLMAELRAFGPDLIGYYVTSTQKHWTLVTAAQVRRHFPQTPQIAGGPHPTFHPPFLLEGELDYLCRGEGEESLLELVQNLESGAPRQAVQNLYQKQDGVLIPPPDQRPLLGTEALDNLPFAEFAIYHHYPVVLGYYRHMFPIIASRGCPLKCTFCYNDGYMDLYKGLGRSVRWRSPENVIEELKFLKARYRLRHVTFEDDAFMLHDKWFQQFAALYSENIHLPFTTQSIANSVSETNVKLLKQMGCVNIRVGLETGDETLRTQLLRKTVTDNSLLSSARLIKQAGMGLQTYNMIGLPGETLQDSLKTYAMNLEMGTDSATCSILKPYPGTAVMQPYLDYYGGTVDPNAGEAYFADDKGRLTTPMHNLQRLMQLGVWLRLPTPVMKRLVHLPQGGLYQRLLTHTYAFTVKRVNHIPLLPFLKMALFSRRYLKASPVPGPQAPLQSSVPTPVVVVTEKTPA